MRSILTILLAVMLLGLCTVTVDSSAILEGNSPPSSVPGMVGEPAEPIQLLGGGGGAGTIYKTYSPTEFKPRNQPITYLFSAFYVYSNTASADFILPMNLPDGARLVEVSFIFRDNDPTYDIWMWLVRLTPTAGSFSDLISAAPARNSTTVFTHSVYGAPILVADNSKYAYQLQFRLMTGNDTHRIYGARVGYSLTTYLPTVKKP